MKLYFKYLSIHLHSTMEYKVSFLLTTLGQFLVSFFAFLEIYFLFERFNMVEGFNFNEILICFSIILISFSIAECFVRGFDSFGSIISNGEFDRIMVRPINEIFQVLASKIELSRIGRLIQSGIIFIYSIYASGIEYTSIKIFTLILMILGGIALFSGLFIIYASFCFFTIEGLEFINIFTDGGREFGKYPMNIYGKNVLKFFTYIVPLACIQYYPLLFLLDRESSIIYMFTPIVGFLFLIPAFIFWRFGVKHYKSTGS